MADEPDEEPGGPPPDPRSQPDVRIDVHGSDNVITTAPKSIAANIKVIFQGSWKPFAVVLFGVGVVLAVILWYVVPRQASQFSKEFNVAVARFQVQDEEGKVIKSDEGETLAETIASQIESNLKELRLDTVTPYEIWGPDHTGVIKSEEEAQKFARSTKATIVIYGTIEEANGISFFSPQFFVNTSKFKEAEEITGNHQLGKDVQGRQNAELILAESPGVQARVDGMSMITIGLVFYSVDRFQEAISYFEKADNPAWVGSGKEVVHLLLGNSYVRMASQTQDFSTLQAAEQQYQSALDVNADYSRAMIGQANVQYLRAIEEQSCDPAGLDSASQLLDVAASEAGQPASANIETKVHFYRGQIALIRYKCALPGEDWPTIAEKEFQWVVEKYEADPESAESQSIEYLASHAYGRLGYLAYNVKGDAEAAIAFTQKAIPLASPAYKAYYTSLLGDMYAATGKTGEAREAYQQALAIAVGNGDQKNADKYQEKLNSISGQ